jgi:hypothetical protein
MREAVQKLGALGPLPDSDSADEEQLRLYEDLLKQITPPVSDEEARILVGIFGPDESYGLAWTVLHLVESAPGWPLRDCLDGELNEWTRAFGYERNGVVFSESGAACISGFVGVGA